MKKIIYISIILLIICVSIYMVWLYSNSHTTNDKSEVTAVSDRTDNFIVRPNTNEILPMFDFTNHPYDEAEFRFIEITNLNIATVRQAQIGKMPLYDRNKYRRQNKIKAFTTKIDTIISASENITPGKDKSAIYNPIAKELNRMSASNATTKILLIYSDMMENTDKITFYDNNILQSIKSQPDKMRQYFESQTKLNNLNGIKIFIIYQPNNTEDDNAFSIVSGFYKQFFESKGATVEITANLN